MTKTGGDIRELLGEHEGIRAHLNYLVKSRETLAQQDNVVLEQLFNYRCALYDFWDAVRYHIEFDERVFGAINDSSRAQNPAQEHEEIKKIILDFITLVDSMVITALGPEQLTDSIRRIGTAMDKIRLMIEAHIARENAVLEETLKRNSPVS